MIPLSWFTYFASLLVIHVITVLLIIAFKITVINLVLLWFLKMDEKRR